MAPARPLAQWGLTEGLVTQVPRTQINLTASDAMSDVVFSNDGRITPRPLLNSAALGWTSQSPLSAFHLSTYVKFDGSVLLMAAALNLTNNHVKIFVQNGVNWTDLTGALTIIGSEDIYPTAANFKGKWFFALGDTNLYQWDGVAAAVTAVTNGTPALAPPTKPLIVLASAAGSNLFLLNWTDTSANLAPYGVAWSAFLDETTWNGGNNGKGSGSQLLADDNLPITSGSVFGPYVLVFKARAMYIGTFQGAPFFYQFIRREEDRGCVAQGSIGSYNNMRIWLGEDNVYMFDGNTVQPLGDRILQSLIASINPAYVNRSIAFVDRFNARYHLFVPVPGASGPASQIRNVFTYHFRTSAWSYGQIDSSILPVSAYQSRLTPWTEQLLLGARSGSYYLYDPTASKDGTAAVVPFWESKVFDTVQVAQGASEVMLVVALIIHAQSGTLTTKISSSDFYETVGTPASFETLGTETFDGLHDIAVTARNPGRYFKIRIEWPDLTQKASVEGFTMMLRPVDGRHDR